MAAEHAKSELLRLSTYDKKLTEEMMTNIIKICEIFSSIKYSEEERDYQISIIERLLRYLPLTPLLGDIDEWKELSPVLFQNKRCPSIFLKNGTAFNIRGKLVSKNGGKTWDKYRKFIRFPYIVPTNPEKLVIKNKKI